jgi:hypothetical protein
MRFAGATTISVALTDTGNPNRNTTEYYRYTYDGKQKTLAEIVPAKHAPTPAMVRPSPTSTLGNDAFITTAMEMDDVFGAPITDGIDADADAGVEGTSGGAAGTDDPVSVS